jgi:hypothetical protein
MAATSKTIILKGDHKNPESAEHHIEFPGGSVSVCRTSTGDYWAHVTVYTEEKGPLLDSTYQSRHGRIKAIRIDTPNGVKTVDHKNTDHFAVLITTKP